MSSTIPFKMRAAHIVKYGRPYALVDKDVPKIKDTELLIRVHAAGFCHSDLQVLDGQFSSPLGMIPSHEPAGAVVQVGSKCGPKWAVGDRVGVLNFKNACGSCPGCGLTRREQGHLDPRFCEHREAAGFQHHGAFAEFMVADPETTVKLPDSLSYEQAAPLMCAGATVWGALERATATLRPGDTVSIVGIGGLGHLGLQFAKAMGFRTIAVDNRPAGRDLAMAIANDSLRPDLVVDSGEAAEATARIYDFTSGEGVGAAVVCTDSLAANAWALRTLRVRGTLGVLGLPADQWRFDADVMVFRELSICATYVSGCDAAERMLKVVEESGIESELTVIDFAEITGIVEAYKAADFRGRLVVRI